MKYVELKNIKVDDVLKASERLANLAMNLAYRGIAHRDVSVLASLNTDQLRRLPAEIRKYFAIAKAGADSDRYKFNEKKRSAILEKLSLSADGLTFDHFAETVSKQVEAENPEVIMTAEQLLAKAQSGYQAAIRAAFRAGLTKADLSRLLAQAEIEARGTASEAKKQAVEAKPVAQPAVEPEAQAA